MENDQNLTNLEEPVMEAPMPTWEEIRKARDSMLLWVEQQYNFDSPKEIIEAWKKYKEELRNLPQKYADLEDLREIEWPLAPNFTQELNLSRLTR